MFCVPGGIFRRQLDVFCEIRQCGLIPSGGSLRISGRDGSSCALAISGSAICVSARILRIVFDRLAEFVGSSVVMFFLCELDAALHMVSSAATFCLLGRVDLNCRATKNRYDRDSDWLLVQHMYLSFWPTFCVIYR